jgi:hypothetical protein
MSEKLTPISLTSENIGKEIHYLPIYQKPVKD